MYGKLRFRGSGVLDTLKDVAIQEGAKKLNINLEDPSIKALAAASPDIASGLYKVGKSGFQKAKDFFFGKKNEPEEEYEEPPRRVAIKPVPAVRPAVRPPASRPVMVEETQTAPTVARGGSVKPLANLKREAIKITHKKKRNPNNHMKLKQTLAKIGARIANGY
jgi:hypothetical protein